MKTLKIILILILIPFLSACSVTEKASFVEINGQKVQVEKTDNATTRYQGLSNRDSLEEGNGMLFVFPDKRNRTFVMRDMNFDIDIVWIDDNRVVSCERSVPHHKGEKTMRKSDHAVNFVLETTPGFCQRHQVSPGDLVTFSF